MMTNASAVLQNLLSGSILNITIRLHGISQSLIQEPEVDIDCGPSVI